MNCDTLSTGIRVVALWVEGSRLHTLHAAQGPRTQIIGVWGPNALKPYYLGPIYPYIVPLYPCISPYNPFKGTLLFGSLDP